MARAGSERNKLRNRSYYPYLTGKARAPLLALWWLVARLSSAPALHPEAAAAHWHLLDAPRTNAGQRLRPLPDPRVSVHLPF